MAEVEAGWSSISVLRLVDIAGLWRCAEGRLERWKRGRERYGEELVFLYI